MSAMARISLPGSAYSPRSLFLRTTTPSNAARIFVRESVVLASRSFASSSRMATKALSTSDLEVPPAFSRFRRRSYYRTASSSDARRASTCDDWFAIERVTMGAFALTTSPTSSESSSISSRDSDVTFCTRAERTVP